MSYDKILITCAMIFAYLLIGYVIGIVMLAIGLSDYEEDVYITCIFWPFAIPIMAAAVVLTIVSIVGKKIAVLPVSIALAIKYVVEKGEGRGDEE